MERISATYLIETRRSPVEDAAATLRWGTIVRHVCVRAG